MEILDSLKTRIALVFPGQGSQYVGMGQQLYDASPAARAVFERANEILGFSLSTLCFEGSQENLDDTINAQPAILTVSVACLEAIKERLGDVGKAISPVVVAGHSLGEFTALVASGVLDFEETLKLVRERGRLMKESSEERPGGMAAVIGLNHDALSAVCQEAQSTGIVTLANDNSPGQTVLSGEIAALQHAMDLAKERGARMVRRLAVSIASHSPLMQQAAQKFGETVGQIHLRPPQVPLLSNITAQALTSVEDLRHELSDQLIRPVQWTRSVQTAIGSGVETFVEVGPRQVLSGLIKRISKNVQSVSLDDIAVAKWWQERNEDNAPPAQAGDGE